MMSKALKYPYCVYKGFDKMKILHDSLYTSIYPLPVITSHLISQSGLDCVWEAWLAN